MSVTAVVHQIYLPATQLDLKRIAAKFGLTDVHTAGCPSDPQIVASRTETTYLSEIIRTLRAAIDAHMAELPTV